MDPLAGRAGVWRAKLEGAAVNLIGILLWAWPLIVADAVLPPESVCRDGHAAAVTAVSDWQRAFDVGGGWAACRGRAQAERMRAVWWAAWWVRWPGATLGQRLHWSRELWRLTHAGAGGGGE